MQFLLSNAPLMFWLLVGHAMADGPLQPRRLSEAKLQGYDPKFPWWLALPAHAGIHAAAVILATGRFELGMLELICHASIDRLKTRDRIGVITDQALHVVCKVLWFTLAVYYFGGLLLWSELNA